MDTTQLASFVRSRGLAVVATTDDDGRPEAALVGVGATHAGEIVFDTSRRSRKHANLVRHSQVALVIGWDDEVTAQVEGLADLPEGADHERCFAAYVAQYPDGADRAADPDIVLVRVVPTWVRMCDYRPDSFGIEESDLVPG